MFKLFSNLAIAAVVFASATTAQCRTEVVQLEWNLCVSIVGTGSIFALKSNNVKAPNGWRLAGLLT